MDQPTEEQLKASFQMYQNLLEGFWAHWKSVQKGTNNHQELARQTIIAALQMAATMAVDCHQECEQCMAQFEELYRQAYKAAPKFR